MKRPSRVIERFRIQDGAYASRRGQRFGAFQIDKLFLIVSDGPQWEHVSASFPDRCPTWADMCEIKGWFWGPDEAVFQLHPPESEYVNFHPHCLHLWRPVDGAFPMPPSILVGPKDGG